MTPFTLLGKALRAVRDPLRYLRAGKKRLLVRGTQVFAAALNRRSFRLQARMDIDESSPWNSPSFTAETGGFLPPKHLPAESGGKRAVLNLEPWDATRRDMLALLLREVETRQVPGAFAEVGVWRGLTAKFFHYYAPSRDLYLFDTFAGFGERAVAEEAAKTGHQLSSAQFADTSEEKVLRHIQPLAEKVRTIRGLFPDSLPEALHSITFAFVHLDADLYDPIKAGLDFFYPRLSPGGIIVVHDYNAWPGARLAVQSFCSEHPEILPIPMPDKSGSCVIQKNRG